MNASAVTSVTDDETLPVRLRRTGRAMWQLRVTIAYAVALIGVSVTLSQLSDSTADRVLFRASTNLHNLLHGHIGTLAVSAFVTEGGATWLWLPGLVALLAVGELLWRSGRLFVVFVIGHVGATVLVAVGLFVAVRGGAVPMSVARAEDVGVSYGAAAVIGALTWSFPYRYRPSWLAMWAAVTITAVIVGRDFTSVGHLIAVTIGAVAGYRWLSDPPAPVGRGKSVVIRSMLAVGTVFALAEIGWNTAWWTVPVVAGTAALAAYAVSNRARVRS